jgi:hypothetical protein
MSVELQQIHKKHTHFGYCLAPCIYLPCFLSLLLAGLQALFGGHKIQLKLSVKVMKFLHRNATYG